MKKQDGEKEKAADLRRKAEEQLKSGAAIKDVSGENTEILIEELYTHQIELEIQNEELRSAQKELEKERDRYSDLYDFAPVGYLTLDEKGMICEANLTAADQLGVKRSTLLNTTLHRYVVREDSPRVSQHLKEVFKEKEQKTSYVRLKGNSGSEIHVQLDSIPVEDAGGKSLCRTIINDVTKRRQAEEKIISTTQNLKQTVLELQKANQKILEQEKTVIEEERLKVLLQMAGATAHELNQPLTVILATIDLMNLMQNIPKELSTRLSVIKKAGQEMADVVKKIQDVRHCNIKPYAGNDSIIDLDQKIKILSVEDSDDGYEKIKDSLKDQKNVTLKRARCIGEAMKLLETGQYEIIFLDYFLPDGNGVDFLETLDKKGMEVPVVVITGEGDEMIASQCIQSGAYDYLTREGVNRDSLWRSLINALEKARLKREVKKAQESITEMSIRDELTGLYNRRFLMEILEREMSRARRYKTMLTLCMIDLDHFKNINDTHGHLAGDMVLSEIGRLLKMQIRQSDLVCRYGGEEFVLVLPNISTKKASTFCERFRESLADHTFKYEGSEFHMTVSIGIIVFNETEPQSPNEFLALADLALYKAKESGRNMVVEYVYSGKSQRPKLGEVLVSEGYVTKEEVEKALSEQRRKLGEVLLQGDRITAQQLDQSLDYQKKISGKLGGVLKKLRYTTDENIHWALSRMTRKLGEILCEKELITENQLQRALVQQKYKPEQFH